MIRCDKNIDGAMNDGIARTVIARLALFWRSHVASVRFVVGSTTRQESGILNVSVRHPITVSGFIQLVTPR